VKDSVPGVARIYYAARGYVLAALLAVLLAARWQAEDPLRFGWLALALAAAGLRAWAGLHIGPHSNGLRLSAGPRAQGGPYRRLRHPLYLSNILMAAALIGFANVSAGWSAALGSAVIGHHALLMRWENRLLAAAGNPTPAPAFAAVSAQPVPQPSLWARQGRNLAYAACAFLLIAWA
jgi:protein-S-isoprenylcysteine O-methyltransferase Ste14